MLKITFQNKKTQIIPINNILTSNWYVEPLFGQRGVKDCDQFDPNAPHNLITEIEIKDITTIKDYAFANFRRLKKFQADEHLESVGINVFFNNSSLQTVNLNNHIAFIGDGAFAQSGITEIDIPFVVEKILYGTFEECENLKTVHLHEGLRSISSEAFLGCTQLQDINLPERLEAVGAWAFQNCSQIEQFVLPSSLTKIDYGAFDTRNPNLKIYCCSKEQKQSLKDSGVPENQIFIGKPESLKTPNKPRVVVPAMPKVFFSPHVL